MKDNGFNSFVGWGVSTLLLWLFNRNNGNDTTSGEQPSKYTSSNANQIGSPVPVVLGRALIKNPLVSYYGDFRADIYTEEYGMHTGIDWISVIPLIVFGIIAICSTPDKVVVDVSVPVISSTGGTAQGVAQGVTVDSGAKRAAILNVIVSVLLWLLTQLFATHMGKTTIQKGFKYYLGWQHILCWTGDNCGIKKIWMNVYDSNVKDSTETGVWDNSNHIAWKSDNPAGIVAHVDNADMFGGVDEGGGFVGDVRFYFGTSTQPKDSWMIDQMTKSENISAELKGLTPRYPMYMTCVIPQAYIGKQATIPEMWFEVVNYPSRIHDGYQPEINDIYFSRIADYNNSMNAYLDNKGGDVKSYISSYLDKYNSCKENWQNLSGELNDSMRSIRSNTDKLSNAQKDGLSEDDIARLKATIQAEKDKVAELEPKVDEAHADTTKAYDDLTDNYPQSEREDFKASTDGLSNLLHREIWHFGKLGDDCNPAEAILEILCNDYWGCKQDHSRIDINSLLVLGITCEEESLGVSCLINNTATSGSYITKILNHINGTKYDDPKTGKLTFKLIRDDYDEARLPVFSTSNCESMEFTRLDWQETKSAVTTSFTDASDKYNTNTLSVRDNANLMITGTYNESTQECPYFTTYANAKVYSDMSLLNASYPLSTINVICNRDAYKLTNGSPIAVTWKPYGIDNQIYRVTEIDYGDLLSGKITFTAVEDVFGFSKTEYSYSDIPSWTTPEKPPEIINKYTYLELPYEYTRSLDTYLYAYAVQPATYDIYWHVWRYIDGNYSKTATTSKYSIAGKLVYGCEEAYDIDADGFEFSVLGTNGIEDISSRIKDIASDPSKYNNLSGLNIISCDDEIMSFDKITLLTNGNYKISGVVRGVYDTIPSSHTAESLVYFIDTGMNVNNSKSVCKKGEIVNEQLEITAETADEEQKFSVDILDHYTTVRRAELPSIMNNLKFSADKRDNSVFKYNFPAGTQFSGDLKFTFLSRNKFSQFGVVSQVDTSSNVLADVVVYNKLEVVSNEVRTVHKDSALEENTNVVYPDLPTIANRNKMLFSWAEFCEQMDNKLMQTNYCNLIMNTYDSSNNLSSYASYKKDIVYVAPIFIGAYTNLADLTAYADSIVKDTTIDIPKTAYNNAITLTYDDCPLLFIGAVSSDSSGVLSNDGKYYTLSTEAYRIVGMKDNKAVLYKIAIAPEYVVSYPFNLTTVEPFGYRFRSGNWLYYKFYTKSS